MGSAPEALRGANRWLPGLALLPVALLIAYGAVLVSGFAPWDDRIYTVENPLVREGLSLQGIQGALTSSWENNWTPAFWIFLASQVSLAGGGSPAVFHAFSLVLCVANAFLLWFVLRSFGVSAVAALAMTVLFSLHPLRVEAVAWIAAQKHLLATTWMLISLIYYLEASRRSSPGLKGLSLVAFAFSLMSSQIGVGLPVFLLAWEMCGKSLRHEGIAALKKTLPYFLISLAAGVLTLYVNWNPGAQVVSWYDHALPHRVLQAFAALGWQISRIFWPFQLAPAYPWPTELVLPLAIGGAMVLSALLALAWTRRNSLVMPGVIGFLACFVPVSGLLAVPIVFTADRLSYLPSIFLAMAGAAALDSGLRRGFAFPVHACFIWGIALIPLTFLQTLHWQNEKTIVAKTLQDYPTSISAQINHAVLVGQDGDASSALELFQKIRDQEPGHVIVWLNEITLLKGMGQEEEALTVGALAIEAIPTSPDLQLSHAMDLERAGRVAEAGAHFQKAHELDPQSVQTTFHHARALAKRGAFEEALPLVDLLHASMIRDNGYLVLRAEVLEKTGDSEGARSARERAALPPRTN